MCASTVASNLEMDVSRTIWQATRARDRHCRCSPRRLRPSWPPRCTSCLASWALLDHLESHRSGRSLDHLHRRLRLEGVQVLALGVDDLPQLLSRDAPDLLPVRLGRTLLHAGGSLQELHRGRRLEHEREGAVLEDRDERGHDVAGLLSGSLVVGLGELHDVDAVRAQGRAHGRRGCGLAGLQLELEHRANLLLTHTFLYVCSDYWTA